MTPNELAEREYPEKYESLSAGLNETTCVVSYYNEQRAAFIKGLEHAIEFALYLAVFDDKEQAKKQLEDYITEKYGK